VKFEKIVDVYTTKSQQNVHTYARAEN